MSDNDYSFSKKPWRMTSPDSNKREWLPGYEGVQVKMITDPAHISWAMRESTWGSPPLHNPSEDQLKEVLDEIASGKTLGAAKEVPALGFVVVCSRSSMDQALRLREAGAAAQTTRDNDMRDFNIIVPSTIEKLNHAQKKNHIDRGTSYPIDGIGDLDREQFDEQLLFDKVTKLIEDMREIYGELVDSGKVPPQDARYVALPLGFQTHYVHILNLRALEKMCEQRLCASLTQHETSMITRMMRDEVVIKYPWMDQALRSGCEKRKSCKGTMLFPSCCPHAESTDFDPEKYLYPSELNDGVQLAEWDKKRIELESDSNNKGLIFSMSGIPQVIANR